MKILSSKLKTISYDSEGNEEITYKTLKKIVIKQFLNNST